MSERLRDYYDFAHRQKCVVPHCHEPVELHHVHGAISFKTGTHLPRRLGIARALIVPLCARHHRTGIDSVHELGENGFEAIHHLPTGHLTRYAASLLAKYVLEG